MNREPSYWDYVKAAFHLKPRIPGCGPVPLNYVVLAGLGFLGGVAMVASVPVGIAVWLLGSAAELGYLYLLSSNPRFQRYVRTTFQHQQQKAAEQQKAAVLEQLSRPSQERFLELEQRCLTLQNLSGFVVRHDSAVPGSGAGSLHLTGLNQLLWIFVRLLASQETLRRYLASGAPKEITRQIETIEKELAKEDLVPPVRKSKQSTLDILKRRLERLHTAQEQFQFIESELQRIEQQVSLLNEEALLNRDPTFLSTRIDSVTETLGETNEWMRMNAEFLGNLDEATSPTLMAGAVE
jgi:hypothetical protein